ncbi:MAG TPA: AbrB/MazE/SpoVT family DNA-binding domain-containing protein [Pseudolabrys sp.]|nr:AbrB/MazE/SpoVT family DNA-binding domain-containing protein [Pseudolabrys sp.]
MGSAAQDMEQVARGLPSKSAKIRALAKAGFNRSQIAKFLACRYQFVRNVLVEEERKNERDAAGLDPEPNPRIGNAGSLKVRLDEQGRVEIPATIREALSLKAGDPLVASVENDELHLLTMPAAARRAQAIIARFIPENVSLVDELLEDRRREVENERLDDQRRS